MSTGVNERVSEGLSLRVSLGLSERASEGTNEYMIWTENDSTDTRIYLLFGHKF